MKKVLIVSNNMHVGGVQKALLNLLYEIADVEDITLLLFYDGGEWRKQIPEKIKVISPNSPFRYMGMHRNDTKRIKDKVERSFWAMITRIFGRRMALKMMIPLQEKLSGFDVAVSFLHSGSARSFLGGCNEFVLHCVESKRKVTFLHCDYEKIGADIKNNVNIYMRFDTIAACSEGCRRSFLRVYPQFLRKTIVIYNCHNYENIRQQAKKSRISLPKNVMNIVTVSRFGKEKGISRAIEALVRLGGDITKIHYFVIGEGKEFRYCQGLIHKFGLQDAVTLIGGKTNPYGYMSAADVLLIPSYSEAAPMVIGEAGCLGTPILTTETSSAYEMVNDTGLGVVCDNSIEGIAKGIKMLIDDPSLLLECRYNIRHSRFDDCIARKQFLEVVQSHEE